MKTILTLCCLASLVFSTSAADSKPNVLFIAIDDLNHWVGHLGRNPQTKTPNIDRLAKMGVAFSKAYCTAPACNPSRASLMSGQRPTTTGCYTNAQNWRPGISEDFVPIELHLVQESPKTPTATRAVAPGVRAWAWQEIVARL